MPSSPFDLRIKTIGGTDIGYMLWKDSSGNRTYAVHDASTISPRFLTEEQITQAQLPADLALTFPQTNWRRGIGGIRYEAKDPDVLADGAQVDVTEQGVLKLARKNTASAVKSGDNPNEYVPSGFAVSGTQLWAFIGRDAYSWDFTDKEWDNQTIAFSQGVTFYKIELRFTLDRKGTGDVTTPELHDFALTCQLRPTAVKLLPLSFYLANGLALNNGMVENKAKTKRNQLRTWDTQGAEVVVTDTEGGTRNCIMLPGQMKETEVRNGYHQFPEYKCDVVLAEVG